MMGLHVLKVTQTKHLKICQRELTHTFGKGQPYHYLNYFINYMFFWRNNQKTHFLVFIYLNAASLKNSKFQQNGENVSEISDIIITYDILCMVSPQGVSQSVRYRIVHEIYNEPTHKMKKHSPSGSKGHKYSFFFSFYFMDVLQI